MDDGSSSPLVQMFPYVALMLDDEVRADIDRLLEHLLPQAGRGEPQIAYAAAIAADGHVEDVCDGSAPGWEDQRALSERLDELVAGGATRAIGWGEPVIARHTDGLSDEDELAVHALVEHRAGLSHDYVVPFEWGSVRAPGTREPQAVDRIAEGRPYRVWPPAGSAPADVWRMRPVGDAAQSYWSGRDYEELLRAVEIAEHTRAAIGEGDAAATDQLAFLLAACFRHAGHPEDIERAVALGREAAETEAGYRRHLAEYLGLRFLHTGDLADLEDGLGEAREAYQAAGDLTEGVAATETLVELLLSQYRATADDAPLFEAGATLGNAAAQIPQDADVWTPRLYGQFAALSLIAFEREHDDERLESAVSWSGAALDGTEKDSHEFPRRLRDHGVALLRSYEAAGDESQLAHAYSVLNWARELTHAGSPERASILLPLAATELYPLPLNPQSRGLLEMAAQREGAPQPTAEWGLLANVIVSAEEVLGSLPEGAPERSEAGRMLATAYRDRFELAGELDDLRRAADAAERAAAEWGASFAVAPVAQKLGASRSGSEIHVVAVESLLMLAGADEAGADDTRRRALALAEDAKSRMLTEQLSREDLPAPPGVPDSLTERERSLLAEVRALDTAALAARGSGVAVRADSRRRQALMEELAQVWDAVARQGPAGAEYVAIRRGTPLPWPQIAELAGQLGAAVLSLFVGHSRTAAFVVRADGVAPALADVPVGAAEWDRAMDRFDRELPVSGGVDDLPPTWQAPLRPFLDALADAVRGCARVVVVPHGPAHALPWMLLSRAWDGPDGRAPAVSTVPALALLDRLRRRPPAHREASVVVGNPTGDLEHAEEEARAVARTLGVAPLIGPEATRSAVAGAAATARLLHLAGHAGFEPSSPLDSAVALCDGPWRARDALEAQVDAELVVLSGCETGAAGALAGDEQAGLVQAFLHAGARSLLVSLWQVDDAATADLMRAFHEHRGGGADAATALATAVEAVRGHHEHPWYWSAFSLVGDAH